MLDSLFDKVCGNEYECFVITKCNPVYEEDDLRLWAIPCESDGEGSNYPVYEKAIKLSDKVRWLEQGDIDERNVGILVWKIDDEYCIKDVEDSHDGFC